MNGDAYLLSRLVDNLVINAIQYSDNGNIKISLKKRDGDVLFKIEDQGIGIDPKELYDIFGAFTVSKKTKSIAGGRGVGLALSKKIVELHKGQIWAESDGKTGSTFFFSLPLE